MTTLTVPHGPAPSPEPMHAAAGQLRYVAVRANLLPDELVATRHSGELKRRLIIALSALLVLLAGWYGFSVWATSSARHDLATAHQHNAALVEQQKKYQNVVNTQDDYNAIQGALAKLMVGDLSWKDMLTTLRAKAPSGVQLFSVSGTMQSGAAAAAGGSSGPGLDSLNQSGQQSVGTLTIAGTAPNKSVVAAYVDALGSVKGLTAAFPSNVTTVGTRVSFSVNAIITTGALGGRFSSPTTTSGGN